MRKKVCVCWVCVWERRSEKSRMRETVISVAGAFPAGQMMMIDGHFVYLKKRDLNLTITWLSVMSVKNAAIRKHLSRQFFPHMLAFCPRTNSAVGDYERIRVLSCKDRLCTAMSCF